MDNGLIVIKKRKVRNLIKLISACNLDFEYSGSYFDPAFEMMMPADLKNYQFEFGDNQFSYQFYSKDENYSNSITIFYDFDGSATMHFYERIKNQELDVEINQTDSHAIYYHKNWQKRNCGSIFIEDNFFISYCTSNVNRENELEKAILTFRKH